MSSETHQSTQLDVDLMMRFLPAPVPICFQFLPAGEQTWRGLACLRLWTAGFTAEQAWRMALSRDPGWSAYLREYPDGRRRDFRIRRHWLDWRLAVVGEEHERRLCQERPPSL